MAEAQGCIDFLMKTLLLLKINTKNIKQQSHEIEKNL